MANRCKFEKYQYQKTTNDGRTWENVVPEKVMKGEIIESPSSDCAEIDTIYRWVDLEGRYICIDNKKYTSQIREESYNGGATWYTSYPTLYQANVYVGDDDTFCCDKFVGAYVVGSGVKCPNGYYWNGITCVVSPRQDTSSSERTIYMRYYYRDPLKVVKCDGTSTLTRSDTLYYISDYPLIDCEIGESVTSIGQNAFGYCYNLEKFTIPSGITSIGSSAFTNCTGLTSITCLATTPPTLGTDAFKNTNNCEILVPCDSFDEYFSAWNDLTNRINPIQPCVLKFDARYNNNKRYAKACNDSSLTTGDTRPNAYTSSAMTSVTIGDCVTTIGYGAFSGCTNLSRCKISNNATYIGQYAFRNCYSLTSVTIPSSVTYIAAYAFEGSSGYTSLSIGSGVTSIGEAAFNGCRSLTSVTIPSSVTSIGSWPFSNSRSLGTIVVESNNAYYDSRNNCNAIIETSSNTLIQGCKNTVIPNTITSINEGAFNGCTSLTSITIPNSVTSIGNQAFARCSSLSSITVPDSVTSIDTQAFMYCDSLTSITAGTGVTYIGTNVALYCDNLQSFTCLATTPPTLGNAAFYSSNQFPIYVPCESLNAYKSASGWSNYNKRIVGLPPCVVTPAAIVSSTSGVTLLDNPPVLQNYEYVFNMDERGESGYIVIDSNYLTTLQVGMGGSSGTKNFVYLYVNGSYQYRIESAESDTIYLSNYSLNPDGQIRIELKYNLRSTYQPYFAIKGDKHIELSMPSNYKFKATYYGVPEYSYSAECDSSSAVTTANTKPSGYEYTAMTEAFIGDCVTSIGNDAFSGCTNLLNITIPSGVTNIGTSAFSNCSGLNSIICEATTPPTLGSSPFYNTNNCPIFVPCESVDTYKSAIGWSDYASRIQGIPPCGEPSNHKLFATYSDEQTYSLACGSSTTLTTGDTRPSGYEYTAMTSANIGNCVTTVGEDAFRECTSLTSVTIPSSVTYIDSWAFYRCSGLTSVDIPTGVTEIGAWAFESCKNLSSIGLPNSLTIISFDCFYNCSSLTSLNIPSGVTSLGNLGESQNVFPRCYNITSITVDESNTVFDSRDNCNAIIHTNTNKLVTGCKNTIIPNSVTSIGDRAFECCSGMTNMYIPDSVTSITYNAFADCYKLTKINIPNGVTSIGVDAFYQCTGLTSINIPDSVTSLGNGAISRCFSLRNVVIGSGITSIGDYGLSSSGVTTVMIKATTPPTITNYTFYNTSNSLVIYVPEASVNTYKTAENWSDYASRIQAIPSNSKFFAIYSGGTTYSAACDSNTTLTTGTTYPSGRQYTAMTNAIIGDCITTVGEYAFKQCIRLTSVDIPTGVTSIDNQAFYRCSGLTSVDIPTGVTSIGDYAFGYCSSLLSIVIPSGVTNIGTSTFANCSSLRSITVNATTPPALGGSVFIGTNDCPIYVPAESVNAYKSAWSTYASRIQAIP